MRCYRVLKVLQTARLVESASDILPVSYLPRYRCTLIIYRWIFQVEISKLHWPWVLRNRVYRLENSYCFRWKDLDRSIVQSGQSKLTFALYSILDLDHPQVVPATLNHCSDTRLKEWIFQFTYDPKDLNRAEYDAENRPMTMPQSRDTRKGMIGGPSQMACMDRPQLVQRMNIWSIEDKYLYRTKICQIESHGTSFDSEDRSCRCKVGSHRLCE